MQRRSHLKLLALFVLTPAAAAYAAGTADSDGSGRSEYSVLGTAFGAGGQWGDWEIYTSLNVLKDTYLCQIEPDGTFDIPMGDDWADGSYKIFLKVQGSLRKQVDVNYVSTGITGVTINLLWGDIDGDNQVAQNDLDFINSKMGMTTTSPEWHHLDEATGYHNNWADLNRDGQVTSVDYNLAHDNLGRIGD